jgi:predicted Co/Zn/Cd cation transporter (cation efflux family)
LVSSKAKNLEQVGSLERGKPSSGSVDTLQAAKKGDQRKLEVFFVTSRTVRNAKEKHSDDLEKENLEEMNTQEGSEPECWLTANATATDSCVDQKP